MIRSDRGNNKNIVLHSNKLAEYYATNKTHWGDFYTSERIMMGETFKRCKAPFTVLDVGCACGGLANAIMEEGYQIKEYCGIDINYPCIEYASRFAGDYSFECRFICDDIVNVSSQKKYDVVICFGAADSNFDFKGILEQCWRFVKTDGCLIFSNRFTNGESIVDINKSYQIIDDETNEICPYNVLNFRDWISSLVKGLSDIIELNIYGYYGCPASSAVTPFKRACFATTGIYKTPISYHISGG